MVHNTHPQHIIFDLDGTLLDTSRRHYAVYCTLIQSLNGTPLSQKQYWRLKRSRTPVAKILSLSALSESKEKNSEKTYNQQFLSSIEQSAYLAFDSLYPGTIDVLTKLSPFYTLCLVTLRRNRKHVLTQLKQLGIHRFFHTIIILGKYKDPIVAKTKAISLCLNGNRGIVVGDTEADIVSGKSLGCVTIALTCGIRSIKLLKSYQPDFLYSGIHQLPRKPSDYFSPRLRKIHTI